MYPVLCFVVLICGAIANETKRSSQSQNNNHHEAFDGSAPVLTLDGYQPIRRFWDMNLDNTLLNSLDTHNYMQNIPVSRNERTKSESNEFKNRRHNSNNALGLSQNAQLANLLNNIKLLNRRQLENSYSNLNNIQPHKNPASNYFNNINNDKNRRNMANSHSFDTLNSKYKDFWKGNHKLNRKSQSQSTIQNKRDLFSNNPNNANISNRRKLQNVKYTNEDNSLDSGKYGTNYENQFSHYLNNVNLQNKRNQVNSNIDNNAYYRRNLAKVNSKALNLNNNVQFYNSIHKNHLNSRRKRSLNDAGNSNYNAQLYPSNRKNNYFLNRKHSQIYNSIHNRNFHSRNKRSLNNAGNFNYNTQLHQLSRRNNYLLNRNISANSKSFPLNYGTPLRNSFTRRNLVHSNLNFNSNYRNQVSYAANNANNNLNRRKNQANVISNVLRSNYKDQLSLSRQKNSDIVDEDTNIESGYDDQTSDYETGEEDDQRKTRSVGNASNPSVRSSDYDDTNLLSSQNSFSQYKRNLANYKAFQNENPSQYPVNKNNHYSNSFKIVNENLNDRRKHINLKHGKSESSELYNPLNSVEDYLRDKRSTGDVYNKDVLSINDDQLNSKRENYLVYLESDELDSNEDAYTVKSAKEYLRKKRNVNLESEENNLPSKRSIGENYNPFVWAVHDDLNLWNNVINLENYNPLQSGYRVPLQDSIYERNLVSLESDELDKNQPSDSRDSKDDSLRRKRDSNSVYSPYVKTANNDHLNLWNNRNNLNNRRNNYNANLNNRRNLVNYNVVPSRTQVGLLNPMSRRKRVNLNPNYNVNVNFNNRRNLVNLESESSESSENQKKSAESNNDQLLRVLGIGENSLQTRRNAYNFHINNDWVLKANQLSNLNNRRNLGYYTTYVNNKRNNPNSYNTWPLRNRVQSWNPANRKNLGKVDLNVLDSNYQNQHQSYLANNLNNLYHRRSLLSSESHESIEDNLLNFLNFVDNNKNNNRNNNFWDSDEDDQSNTDDNYQFNRRSLANTNKLKLKNGVGLNSNVWGLNLNPKNRKNLANNANRKQHYKNKLQNDLRRNLLNYKALKSNYRSDSQADYENQKLNLNSRRNNENNNLNNRRNLARNLYNKRNLQNSIRFTNANALNNGNNFRDKRSLNRLQSNHDFNFNLAKRQNYLNRRRLENNNAVPANYWVHPLYFLNRRNFANSDSLDSNISEVHNSVRKVKKRKHGLNSDSVNSYDNDVVNSVYNANKDIYNRKPASYSESDETSSNSGLMLNKLHKKKQAKNNKSKGRDYHVPYDTHLQYQSKSSSEFSAKQQNKKLRLRLGDKGNNGFNLKLKLNIPTETRSANNYDREDDDNDPYLSYFHKGKGNNINVRRDLSYDNSIENNTSNNSLDVSNLDSKDSGTKNSTIYRFYQDNRRNQAYLNAASNLNNRRNLENSYSRNNVNSNQNNNRRNSANSHSSVQSSNVLNHVSPETRRNLAKLKSLGSSKVVQQTKSE